jgi:hypothetical protein
LLWKKGLFYTSVEAIFSIHAMNENRSMWSFEVWSLNVKAATYTNY